MRWMGRDGGGVSVLRQRQCGLASHLRAALAGHRETHGRSIGGALPARHDGARFQWATGPWLGAAQLRGATRHVLASDLRRDDGARAAGCSRCLDVGARVARHAGATRRAEGKPALDRRLAELAPQMPNTRLVYVADREADMLPLMKLAQDLDNPVDWLVRAAHDRSLPESATLWAHTTHGPALGEIEFALAARPGVKARTVRQQLWARHVELPAGKGKLVSATCIVAREVGAPAGVKPIEWRLLTNRAATTADEIAQLIEWYRARWEIEILFNVLKNGCQVEELQLGAVERIERALAMYLVV